MREYGYPIISKKSLDNHNSEYGIETVPTWRNYEGYATSLDNHNSEYGIETGNKHMARQFKTSLDNHNSEYGIETMVICLLLQ